MTDLNDLRRMRADEMAETTCSAEVTRDGDADVCYLPATGWAWDYDEFSEPALYRACVHHEDHTGPVVVMLIDMLENAQNALRDAIHTNKTLAALTRERNTWARQMADLHDERDTMQAQRDNAQDLYAEADTERVALSVKLDEANSALERVRALHYPADNDGPRTPRCEHCEGKAGAHPCGCWAERDRQPVCGECNAPKRGARVDWPCPTLRALDGEAGE